MGSIPKTASFWLTQNGLIVRGQETHNPVGFTDETRATRQKGDITGFSAASRLRLRYTLARMQPRNSSDVLCGCCLTIPGAIISQERASKIWHTFSKNNCRRKFKGIPIVWRVELQKRGQPHWHLTMYLPAGRAGCEIRQEFGYQWRRFIRDTLTRSDGCLPWSVETDEGFEFYGVRWKNLRSMESATKYLAPELDHESKRKQDQLGWKGRQWGIINRDAIDLTDWGEPVYLCGAPVGRIIARFKTAQDARRASGRGYVGASVGEHMRLPSVLYGTDADILADIVRDELRRVDVPRGTNV